MNLLFNVSNLRFGGGVSVAQSLLEALIPQRQEDNLYIIAPQNHDYERFASFDNASVINVPDRFHTSWPVKYYYNNIFFKKLVSRYHIDKVISLGNIAFPSGAVPQLLLLQNAWPLYPESSAWQVLDHKAKMYNTLMNAWTEKNLSYAGHYALQTEIMQERFCRQYGIAKEKTFILPNSVRITDEIVANKTPGKAKRLLMLSKYYPHKNFDILIPLAQLIKNQLLDITISVTIDATGSSAGKAFFQKLKTLQLDGVISNLGDIPHKDLQTVYRQHDALLFPTLLESFSGTYIEAMHYGLPVFTSDRDFAHGICGDTAFYFDPLDAGNILEVLTAAFNDPQLVKEKMAKAAAMVRSMPNWQQIATQFSEIIDTFE